MPVTKVEIRSGAYYDSVILMQLQHGLAALPGVLDAGVVMGTAANKEILAQSQLLTPEAQRASAEDLLIVVRATDLATAETALGQVDGLLARRRAALDQEYRPKSLETAVDLLPQARWVLVSVAGRYAAAVARQALTLGRSVFLYSDNVTLEDETALKTLAAEKGLLVMGPDCGTAIVNGIGLGFANQVRRGKIGLVAAAGTGLQQVSSRIHQLGGGVSHALGTGGRDLSEAVGGTTALQALDLLRRDPATDVIVLISKPPALPVADRLLEAARSAGKPVVVDFIGYARASRRVDNIRFAATLDEAAELAVGLTKDPRRTSKDEAQVPAPDGFAAGQRYIRGLFSGGTLAYEALLILQDYLPAVYSNAPLDKATLLPNALVGQVHTIIDLGADEFTVGRLHPMMDNDLRIRRLAQEAADPEVAVILLDVVLGHGAHPDPASELAPAIAAAIGQARDNGRRLDVVVILVGTDEDPQGMPEQAGRLRQAGARLETSSDVAVRSVGRLARALNPPPPAEPLVPVDLMMLDEPLAAINIGLETFAQSLVQQGAAAVHVDWRPPAGGNERLAGILARMRAK